MVKFKKIVVYVKEYDVYERSDGYTKDSLIKETTNSKQCPSAVSCRSTRSLLREWEAHNMLYSFGYEVERTQHVDFDREPFSRQFVYLLLSIAYRSRIF